MSQFRMTRMKAMRVPEHSKSGKNAEANCHESQWAFGGKGAGPPIACQVELQPLTPQEFP